MNLEEIRKNLLSDNPADTAACLEKLGKEGSLSDLQTAISHIKNPDHAVKKAAIKSATTLIKENLIAHFNDLEPDVKKKLGAILESLDPGIITGISADIYCNDDNRRLRAVQILGLIKKHPKIRELLADLVKDNDQKIRATAINLLGKVTDAEDYHIILSLLSDQDKRVKANTVEALESLGDRRVIPVLKRFQKDPNNRIRGNVIKALYKLGYKEINDNLMEMLKSNNNFMVASGLWVISQISLANTEIEDLSGWHLISSDEMIKRNALNALKALKTPRANGYLRYLDAA